MIDTYNLNEITWKHFRNNYIYKNKPCIIKKFINNTNCPIEKIIKYVNDEKNLFQYKIGNVTAMLGNATNLCNNHLVKGIENEMFVTDKYRIWKHNKNNKTKWHYDGHGGDLYNLCIQGSKHFYLAPPGSFPVYPLSNIAYDIEFKEKYLIKLNPYDMLYIPSYWFHKVITLEDNTINMNYTFFGIHNKKISSKRDRELYTLHNIFNTNMCVSNDTKPICNIYANNIYNYPSAIFRGLYETILFFIIFLILTNIHPILSLFYILCIFIIFINNYLNYVTSGITKIVSFFTLLWIYLYIIFKFIISKNIIINK
jgi:hypothetical protein